MIIYNMFKQLDKIAKYSHIMKVKLQEFIQHLEDTHGIDKSELESVWRNCGKHLENSDENNDNIKNEEVKEEIYENPTKCLKTENNSAVTCPYIFIKGKRVNEICGSKSVLGQVYCIHHKSNEGKDPKSNAKRTYKVPKPLDSIVSSMKGIQSKPTDEDLLRPYLNKDINKMWHPSTKMVFESSKKLVVIGRYIDGEIRDLTKEDIKICKKTGFEIKEDTSKKTKDIVETLKDIHMHNSSEEESDNEESTDEEFESEILEEEDD